MSTIAIIPARYASTRFPGKPLALLHDKPMIQHTYENTKKAKSLDRVVVATDDHRIMEAVFRFGGEVVTTGKCASGSDRCYQALKQMEMQGMKPPKYVINIQGDEPLVNPQHIDLLVTTLKNSRDSPMVALAAKIYGEEELRDRATSKVVMDRSNKALYFSRAIIPHSKSGKYNPNVEYYKNCGMYGFTRKFLELYSHTEPSVLQLEEDLEQLKTLEMGESIQMAKVEWTESGVDYPEQLERLNQDPGLKIYSGS
jgi:3-deoxy-manno-octulosonate cytidylyltransferase (CMP-KDO synthetase)